MVGAASRSKRWVRRRFELVALLGVIWATVIVGAFLVAASEAHPFSPQGIAVLIAALATLVVSARILLPSLNEGFHRRLAMLSELSNEERRVRLLLTIGRQRIVLILATLLEIPIALLLWTYPDWRPWLVAVLGTTVLSVGLTTVLLLRLKTPRAATSKSSDQ